MFKALNATLSNKNTGQVSTNIWKPSLTWKRDINRQTQKGNSEEAKTSRRKLQNKIKAISLKREDNILYEQNGNIISIYVCKDRIYVYICIYKTFREQNITLL